MDKSPEAFRTISEVAESLETPAHVLRFWESRFPQIKPVKRAGGRRYYRPADVALLGGIRHLLHDEGMTIRGVQKILREQGVRHVAAMSAGSEDIDFDADLLDGADEDFALAAPEPETAQVVALEPGTRAPTPPPATPAEVVQLRSLPDQPTLPLFQRGAPAAEEPVEVPEAGHVWVEDEDDTDLHSPAQVFPVDTVATPPDQAAAAALSKAGSLGLGRAPAGLPDNLSEGFVISRDALSARSGVAVVPEAGDVPETALPPVPTALPLSDTPLAEGASVTDLPPDAVPALPPEAAALQLSGIAARLRALPRPLSDAALAEALELHSRLGLLHAQMVEAQRTRR